MAYGRVRFLKNPQDAAHTKNVKTVGPAWVERTVDNYNHLFEQPVAFYVITISIATINNFDPILIQCAWVFVSIRIIHSIVQITCNIVILRFILFVVGWFIIAYMSYSQLLLFIIMINLLIGLLFVVLSLNGNSIIHYIFLFSGLSILAIALKKL
jgi:hypothetical protein